MTFSPFKKPFEERLLKWEATLKLISEVLEEWVKLQRQWMYLEPIFSSDDIMQQLPMEAKRFQAVDRTWRKVSLCFLVIIVVACALTHMLIAYLRVVL